MKVNDLEDIFKGSHNIISMFYKASELHEFTHWGWDNLATIFKMTFSNYFFAWNFFLFLMKTHLNLFPMVQLTKEKQQWFRWWLSTQHASSHYLNQWKAIIWTNVGLVYMHQLALMGWCDIQYIPRNMHTVFALMCFVVVIHWLIFPYPSGLLHWHCGNLTIAPVPAKQPWWIWINTSCEFIMNDCITTTKQSTTKPCAYFLGYTVLHWVDDRIVSWSVAYYALSDRRCMEISPGILINVF